MSGPPGAGWARRASPIVTAVGLVMTGIGVVGGLTAGDGGTATPAAGARPTTATTDTAAATATAGTTATPTTPTTTRTTSTTRATVTTTAPAETPQTFFTAFGRAIAGRDTAFLFDRLHPLVLTRYGAEQCRTYLNRLAPPAYSVTVLDSGHAEPWDWTTDGRTDRVAAAFPVRIRSTEDGTTFRESDAHVALVDGRVRWFTDCGTPV